MSTVLELQPGQTATIFQQILVDGYRADGYAGAPVIARIFGPGFTLLPGYPVTMTRLDVGLYYYSFTLPSGGSSVGLYVADLYWYDPITDNLKEDVFLINVTAPFGVYSVISTG